jgi:hypothetical protein
MWTKTEDGGRRWVAEVEPPTERGFASGNLMLDEKTERRLREFLSTWTVVGWALLAGIFVAIFFLVWLLMEANSSSAALAFIRP